MEAGGGESWFASGSYDSAHERRIDKTHPPHIYIYENENCP